MGKILGANGRELESSVKSDVLATLDELDDLYYFVPPAGLYGQTGISDVLGLRRGLMFALEVKRDNLPDTTPTVPQRLFMADIRRAGGLAFRVDRSNIDTLRTRILRHCERYAAGSTR